MSVADHLVRAAGCVPWRRADIGTDVEWLVVHRPRYDDWSFPKGKLEPGEEWLEAALRELDEETGLTGTIGSALDDVHYVDHKGRDKVVRYWSLHISSGAFVANDEVDEVAWLRIADARALLSYEHDRALLDQADRSLSRPPPPS